MPQWNDELQKSATEQAPPPEPRIPRPAGLWIAAAIVVLGAAIGAYFMFGRAGIDEAATTAGAPPAEAAPVPPPPLGGTPEPIDLPPLEDTDPLVRRLVAGLSSHPRVAAWLATDGLVRNFTTVVVNVAEGRAPAALVRALRPADRFAVREVGEDLELDPRSYTRYNALADAVASVDATQAATLYATLKPRLEDAHRELGYPNTSFDEPLRKAIVMLLDTPVVEGPIQVHPKGGIAYAYADPTLEGLTGAQKQLLRMGPRNVRLIQAKLRDIALALGIPAAQLPRPS